MDNDLGLKIKELRLAQKMTLKDLSRPTDFSISYISQVERGVCAISLASLEKIADSLGVPASSLLNDGESESGHVFYAYEQEIYYSPQEPVFVNYLGPLNPAHELQAMIVNVLPVAGKAAPITPPLPGEGFIYVLEGSMQVQIDGKSTVLNAGDSIHFRKDKKYRYSNRSRRMLRLLFVGIYNGG